MLQEDPFPQPIADGDHERKPGDRRGLLLALALYSNPCLFSVVRGAVERLTEAMGFPAVQCRSITRAIDEALTNIVRHCYGNRLDQPIALYFQKTQRSQRGQVERGLEILVCDYGPAVDLNKLRGRPFGELRPGGLGLHLIRQAMDTVEFTRKGSTNQLRLVKYLAEASNAP